MCLQESVVPPSICWNMQALVLRPENRAGRLRAIQLSGSREMTTGIRSGGNPPEIQVGDSHASVLDTFASCNHHGDADGVRTSAIRGRQGTQIVRPFGKDPGRQVDQSRAYGLYKSTPPIQQ